MQNHMILLNGTGDVTIAWDESQNVSMREMIEKKCWGLFEKKLKVRSVHDIKGNSITIADDSLAELFNDGRISVSHNTNDIVNKFTPIYAIG